MVNLLFYYLKKEQKMMKVNIGLSGILIIILTLIFSNYSLNKKINKLTEDTIYIKEILEDIDNDLHEIIDEK